MERLPRTVHDIYGTDPEEVTRATYYIFDDRLEIERNLTEIRELTIFTTVSMVYETDEPEIWHISKLTNLKSVKIYYNGKYTDGLVLPDDLFEGMTQLSEVYLRYVNVDLKQLLQPVSSTLTSLYLVSMHIDSLDEIALPELEVLQISDCVFKSDMALYLNNCPKLWKLEIEESGMALLPDVQDCTELEIVRVRSTDLREDNISSYDWSELKKLVMLEINDCDIRGTLNSTMRQLTNLQLLNVANNRLDGDLSNVSSLTNLRELNLLHNRFEGSLDYLIDLPVLRYLDISGTNLVLPAELLLGELIEVHAVDTPIKRLPDVRTHYLQVTVSKDVTADPKYWRKTYTFADTVTYESV